MTVHHLALGLYHWMKRQEEPEEAMAARSRLETELSEARKAVAH